MTGGDHQRTRPREPVGMVAAAIQPGAHTVVDLDAEPGYLCVDGDKSRRI